MTDIPKNEKALNFIDEFIPVSKLEPTMTEPASRQAEAHRVNSEVLAILDPVMPPAMAKGFVTGAMLMMRAMMEPGPTPSAEALLRMAADFAVLDVPELAKKMRKLDREATAYSRGRVAHGEGQIEVAPRDEDDPEKWRRGWLDAKAEADDHTPPGCEERTRPEGIESR